MTREEFLTKSEKNENAYAAARDTLFAMSVDGIITPDEYAEKTAMLRKVFDIE